MAYNKYTWEYGETITASKLNNMEDGIKANDTAIGNIPETIEEIQTELEQKANVDGAYESMTVGNAEQLVSTQYTEDQEPYIYRTSGGSADIGNREEDTIVGGSIAWNQLVQNGNFANGKEGWTTSGTNTVSDGALTFTTGEEAFAFILRQARELYRNHKYLVSIEYKIASSANVPFRFSYNYDSIASGLMINKDLTGVTPNVWQKESTIYGPNPSGDMPETGFRIGFTSTNPFPANNSISFRNIVCYDLTAMFGTAVADAVYAMEQANAGSGVAWFKAQYPLDYYEYDAGTLKSVEGLQSHDMVGFNQWDEEWELGSISNTTGVNETSNSRIRSKNYIPVIAGATYYILHPGTTARVLYYDASKTFIKASATFSLSKEFTIPDNTHYIRFWQTETTYNNDICINLSWSGTRNGEYEPYVKHSYPLDSSLTLRGIPKWGTDGMYYDGDTYESDGTVTRKYGIVDLGTLNWGYNTNYTYFSAPITSMITQPDKSNYIPNIKCAKYITYQNDLNAVTANHPDKTISSRPVAQTIYVKDSAYTDATAFKTAMSGVMLVYELATPTTETAEPYTNPQIVDDFGTEEYVTTGKVAVGHETKYMQNLRDKLQHLPNLADSDGAYMIQQTGTQMTLVLFRIPKAENLADGTYTLKATVSGGTPTYEWVAEGE